MAVGTTTSYRCACGEQFDITSPGRVVLFLVLGSVNVAVALWAWVAFALPVALVGLLLGLGFVGWALTMQLPARANPPFNETDRP